VIGVELFELAGGKLLVNEFAPRVHNTGHWTQDGCEVDQFEQHIRAVAGWPLGPTAPRAHVEMTNLLGPEVEAWAKLAAEPETRIHLYGKGEARPGRKMGHVNRLRGLALPEGLGRARPVGRRGLGANPDVVVRFRRDRGPAAPGPLAGTFPSPGRRRPAGVGGDVSALTA
jgi:hypothetical protein